MKIYPVINVTSVEWTMSEVAKVVGHNVSGVFLIDHDANDLRLAQSIGAVSDAYPDLFLGANFIRRSLNDTLSLVSQLIGTADPLSAVWSDNAGLDALLRDPALEPPARPSGWSGLHFGGVAFKYQAHIPQEQLPLLGQLARTRVDVAVTSGPGTGLRADLHRLRALRAGLGDRPLAVASGITPENVVDYLGLADHALVATGISRAGSGIHEPTLDLLLKAVADAGGH